jgi:hypothetical protein
MTVRITVMFVRNWRAVMLSSNPLHPRRRQLDAADKLPDFVSGIAGRPRHDTQ